jgi:hypothetical protein
LVRGTNYMARVSRTKRSVIGINWNLKYRLKIEDQEHTIDDLRSYVRQLERKNKKLLLKTT